MQVAQAQQLPLAQAPPNILFILMDNLGYGELGVYGGGILRGAPTPRIDQLAAEGTRLTILMTSFWKGGQKCKAAGVRITRG
jgi:arylsulfatase A-like enzyme